MCFSATVPIPVCIIGTIFDATVDDFELTQLAELKGFTHLDGLDVDNLQVVT